MVTMWHIWDARNKAREEEVMFHPTTVTSKVKAYVHMILDHLYSLTPHHRCVSPSSLPKWIPPPVGSVMVTVDAAGFAPSRRMGVGVVIRDYTGSFLAACRETFVEVIIPELAEARAVFHGISFAEEEGFSNIVIGSDCLSVVQRLNSPTTDRSTLGSVLDDIKRLAVSFSSCEFRHVFQTSNEAAHLLARSCASFPSMVWHGVSPDLIWQTICAWFSKKRSCYSFHGK